MSWRHEFLEIRRLYIQEMLEEGATPQEVVRTMAMDPTQVSLIGMTNSPLMTGIRDLERKKAERTKP